LHLTRKDFIPSHNRGIRIAQEPKTIGEHLRRRRAQLKLHQRQAAQRLHVSTVTLSRWERDHTYPTWDYHARLIEYLGYDAFKQTGLKDPYGNEPHGVAFFAVGESEAIGQRIRRKRLELKLTVDQFAKKLGVSDRTLRDWESDTHRPTKKMVERITRFFGDE
jgi:transcriptional regulator with XRE-family HTH domain